MTEKSKKLEVLVLEGTARERGRAHGEALRDLIHEHHSRWLDALQKQTGMDEQLYLDRLLAETNFMPAIERWTPDLLDEVRGIAEGANILVNIGGLAVMSQLEAAAAAHFYASLPARRCMPAGEFIFGLGVAGPDPLVAETDFVIEDGHVRPPSGPGMGVTIDEAALAKLTLLQETVT